MQPKWRQRVLAAFVVAVAALSALPAWTGEEGRRVHVESDKRSDERANRDEKPAERKARSETDRALKEIDPRRNPNGEFKGADELEKIVKGDEAKWKDIQAIHAMEGHEKEFANIGISDIGELKKHIDNVRNNYDIHITLPRGRELYAKMDNGKEGTIIIDNPNAENGGTAFRASDVRERATKISESQ